MIKTAHNYNILILKIYSRAPSEGAHKIIQVKINFDFSRQNLGNENRLKDNNV